ncbi:MAG: UvrD-helicase domain-containing protein [Bacteroidetes bacterium]|nr:UvrD-helicase domain-containing protein [Bacteroidota bacterium]
MSFLPNDTTLQFPHVFVIPASAGSGKTYTLAHRYVQFLLSGTIPSAGLRNILAITFTKLAAKEMKERIIALLKKAALGESGTVQELQSLVDLPKEEIIRRSEHLVQQILRHYSDFNVRTIDSFLTTVFKASAMELGVQPNVELQFDHDAIIGQAFRQYSQNLREGSDEARFIDDLVRLIESNDTGTGGYLWNPFTKIVREVRQLQRQFGRYAQEPVSLEGSGRLQELETRIREQARTLRPMLEASSLLINAHFSKEVERLAAGDVFAVATKGKTKKYFNKFSDDAGAAPELQKLFAVIRPMERDLAEYVTVYAHTYYQPFVQAVKLIGRTIREVKLLEGTVVIDDVNRSLANYLSDDVVPEVYLKLGERIAHFMIDEFQDTSPIQWKNLTPLIEEALAKTGSLFAVGDTKQSIYGFRGADWHIFRDLIDGRYFPSAPAAVLPLTTNYRSAQALVDFVKDVFSVNIAAAGFEEYAKASGLYNFAQEVPPAEQGKGYVDVQLIQKSEEEEEGSDLQRDYVLGTIRDCCARGYSYGDIAILTPANADVVEISSWLNNARIPFLSLSTLDIRKRTVIGEVIALLRFLDSPVDELSFMTFLSGSIMAKNAPVLTRDHIREFAAECRTARTRSLYRAFRDRYPEEWERYFDRLFSLAGYMPLYDIVSEVYKTFRLFERCAEEESALVKLLECVKQFEQQGNNSLKDFLVFSSDEGADAWSIDVPSSVHAVRVMTVHKAKGLGFPVVIVSLREKRPPHSAMVMKETEQGVAVLRVGRTYGERNETLGSIYEEKQREQVIDELNKIYVALTRARKEMYVSVIYKKQENLPAAILPARRYGSPYAAAEKERRPAGLPLVRPLYRTEPVTVPAAKHQRIGVAETHRGDVVHELLSHITFIGGPLNEAVQAAIAALPVRLADETAAESAAVQDFLAVPEVLIHFERKEGRRVLCEQDIAAKSGRLFRMDRVIIDPDTVTVVDFKTGSDEHHSEYEEQVRNYMAMLQEIYPGRNVQGALLYVDLKKGVPVR